MGVEDDDGDLAVAQYRQLVSLLHQAELPLGERHLDVLLISARIGVIGQHKQETAAAFRLYGLDNCLDSFSLVYSTSAFSSLRSTHNV